MANIQSATILRHTTSSTPSPHVLFVVEVKQRMEFVFLRKLRCDTFQLPPKRSVTTSVVPSAWVNDALIEERKTGLGLYLQYLLADSKRVDLTQWFFALGPLTSRLASLPLSEPQMAQVEMAFNTMNTAESLFFDPSISADEPDKPSEGEKRKFLAASYYPSWASSTYPVNKIDFSKFDIIFYAFVIPTASADISWDGGSQTTLRNLVSAARKSGHGTKIVLSVGGWSGSYWFNQTMSTSANRTKLLNALVKIVNNFGLDGVDMDWEYPNSPGAGNPYSSTDSANLLSFFKILRSALGPKKIISAAVTQLPWIGSNGRSLKSVADFAAQMTYVNIMNYDVFGASANPGPNAPLGNLCGTSSQPQATAEASLAQWTKAGFPASKLLLGLPNYGYVSRSSATKLSNSFDSPGDHIFPPHPRLGAGDEMDTCAPQGDLSSLWGQQIAFKQLVSMGAIRKREDGVYVGANGYKRGWDKCSDTPYVYNQRRTTVVTYDDPASIASKTRFAKKSGMAGCFTWSMDQDDNLALHNSILSAAQQ